MRAVVVRDGALVVGEVERPVPGPQQVLARVRACGVCGSDLHALDHARARRLDGVIMGHEFVAEIVEVGPGAERWAPGTRVVSTPSMPPAEVAATAAAAGPCNYFLVPGTQTIGYSLSYPGGFGEYLVLSAPLLVPVPPGLSDRLAATTEPCAVGLHAVRAARLRPGEHALVMGAGPIGLMTLLWLKREGVRHVTVTEMSAPRRAIAEQLGADLVLDPRETPVAERLVAAAGGLPPLVFECVGVPGTLQQAIDLAAVEGRVIVVGVCATPDQVVPATAIGKHLALQFVLAYTAAEIAEAAAAIADGSIDPSPLISRVVTLEELPAAFEALRDPAHCKVLVEFP
jgi:threonine dehydrogenase-like Zn-dependent dehydrogenase